VPLSVIKVSLLLLVMSCHVSYVHSCIYGHTYMSNVYVPPCVTDNNACNRKSAGLVFAKVEKAGHRECQI
jgi:hypothetical protein